MRPLDADRVREWRHRRMLSQQEVADRAGISLFTIQRIERGEGNVRPKTGRAVAAALGVPIEELFPKAQAPLWSDEPVEERRPYISQLRQLEQWKMYLEGCAERWELQARNPNTFASAEAAAGASVEANRQGIYLFRTIRDRLLPTIRDQFPEEIAHEQMLELDALVDRLNEALAIVVGAAGRTAESEALLRVAEQERNAEVMDIRERLTA